MESGSIKGIGAALWEMYKNEEDDSNTFKCTIRVSCGQIWVTFHPHKLILKMWSYIFEDSLAVNSVITITDFSPSVIEALINFLYGFKDDIKAIENPQFLLDLYKAGERYEILELKRECCKVLGFKTVNFKNVFDILKAADYMELNCSKLRCIKVLTTETVEVFSTLKMQDVTHFMVHSILNLQQLSLSSESELLSWVFEWAELEVERRSKEDNSPNLHLRIILPFLPYLNFTSLKAKEFVLLVDNHKKFFNESDGFCILMNILHPGTKVRLPDWLNKSGISRKYKDEKNSMEEESIIINNEAQIIDNSVSESTDQGLESVSSSDNSTLDLQTKEFVKSTVHAVNNHMDESYATNSSRVECNIESTIEADSECSYSFLDQAVKTRKKIKKRKLKTHYLLPGSKRDSFSSCQSWSGQYSSGDFDSLIGEVWKQQKYTNLIAGV